MKEKFLLFALIFLPFIIMLISFVFPVIPFIPFIIFIVFLSLIFGSIHKWDDSLFKDKMFDILKIESAIIVFGISLWGLVLQNLVISSVVNVEIVASFLLLSSGFFVFSMIFGVLYLLGIGTTNLRKYLCWAVIANLFFGLFSILLGWSLIIQPIISPIIEQISDMLLLFKFG